MKLIRYDQARKALQECVTVDEAKDMADKAAALQVYAKQHGDNEMECWVAEIKLRAKRRIGEISLELEKIPREDRAVMAHEGARRNGATCSIIPKGKREVLQDAGIGKDTAHRCEKLAKVSEEKFDEAFAELKKQNRPITYKDIEKVAAPGRTRELLSQSDQNDWRTPRKYLDAARAVLGQIDLDPASSEEANQTVLAKKFYTEEMNGLKLPWKGRVWLNPPYGGKAKSFIERLIREYQVGNVTGACALVNSHPTETKWFQLLFDYRICFIQGRIDFGGSSRAVSTNSTHGSAIVYLGDDIQKFSTVFSAFGAVMKKDVTYP